MLPYTRPNGKASIVLFLFYFAAASLGLSFEPVSDFATLVWPATGIAVASVFLFGYGLWPGIALGAFLANFLNDAPLLVALAIAVGNTLEAVAGAWLLKQYGFNPSMRRLIDILYFILYGSMVAPTISATIGVTSLWIGGIIDFSAYAPTWGAWWIGDMVGALLVGPFILVWLAHPASLKRLPIVSYQTGEALFLFFLTIISGLIIFWQLFRIETTLAYYAFIPLIWSSLRLGPRGAVAMALCMAALAVAGTIQGLGPFSTFQGTLVQRLLPLQFFLVTISSTSLILSAALSELSLSERKLKRINESLEQLVNERTMRLNRQTKMLGQAKAHDEAVLRSIADGLIITDHENRVVRINPCGCELTGWEENEIIGKNLLTTLESPADKRYEGKSLRVILFLVQQGKTVQETTAFIKKDRFAIPVAITASPIVVEGIYIGAAIIFRDITKEQEADRAKTEFVSLVSHQLRTPLTIIRWYVGLLAEKESGSLTTRQKAYVRKIYQGNIRMTEIVNALLQMSRVELDSMVKGTSIISLEEFLRNLIIYLRPRMAEKKQHVIEDYNEHLPSVYANALHLQMVFQNLLVNATKYTPEGGTITVQTFRKHLAEKDGSRRDYSVVKIRDTGYGIPAHQQPQIFVKLFRADNARELDSQGLGLGLYVAKLIIERMNGRIWFTSKEGKGTTFYVALPIPESTAKIV